MLRDEVAQGSAEVIRNVLSWIFVGFYVRAKLRIVCVGKLHPKVIHFPVVLIMIHC